jgi:hypothetical protein
MHQTDGLNSNALHWQMYHAFIHIDANFRLCHQRPTPAHQPAVSYIDLDSCPQYQKDMMRVIVRKGYPSCAEGIQRCWAEL